MRKGRNETLHDFTERAIDATLKGILIPPIVYVPHGLRKQPARVMFDGGVTLNPATPAENQQRIAQADPVGFLIAVMQGQPIPRIILEDNRARVEFMEPPLDLRVRAAEALKINKGKAPAKDDAGYEAMIQRAAEDGED